MLSYKIDVLIKTLVRNKDIKQNLWTTTPYIKDKNSKKYCSTLLKKYKRVNQEFFSKFKISLPKHHTIKIWLKKGIFPLLLLPLINIKRINSKISRLSNRDGSSSFNPFKLKLNNANLFYLIGCIIGDGNFSHNTLSIYDGYPNKDYINYSKEFLLNLKTLFIKLFKINQKTIKVYKHKTQNNYILQLNSKWLMRFFNHFFNIPYGNKTNVNLSPKNFKITNINLACKRAFCQGLFDTDGSIHPISKNMTLVSQNEELLIWVKKFFSKLDINTKEIRQIKNSKELKIPVLGFRKFKKQIGFNHPRKKLILEKHALNPIRKIVFKGLKKNSLYKCYFNIFKIKNLRISPGGWLIKEMKNKYKINGKELGKKIKLSQPFISEIENNKKALNLSTFSDIILKIYKKEEFYKRLSQQNCLFLYRNKGGGTKKVNLPLIWSEEIDNLAKEIKVLNKHKCYFRKDKALKEQIENLFKIKTDNSLIYNYQLNYETIVKFLNTFYIYKNRI